MSCGWWRLRYEQAVLKSEDRCGLETRREMERKQWEYPLCDAMRNQDVLETIVGQIEDSVGSSVRLTSPRDVHLAQ